MDREKIEIFISGRKLKSNDVFSESDPKVKLYYWEGVNGNEQLIGQTESLKNNANPDFKTTIELFYIFEKVQHLRFEVWDVDETNSNDIIGFANTTVGELMGAKNQVLVLQLKFKGKHNTGYIIVKADQVKQDNFMVKWQWSGKKLMNTDGWFGKSDPFLIFFRQKDGLWLKVHETAYIKDTLNPVWPEFQIPAMKLTGGKDQLFKVECWDNSKSGKHNFIGHAEINLNQLNNPDERKIKLINPNEKKPGKLILQNFQLFKQPTFIEYLQGGEQINMMVAIDFTGSNGDPNSSSSLHSIVQGQMNQYQTALYQVSSILLNYDHDRRIPLYGFGGVPQFPNYTQNQADHCFPLTGSFQQPEVDGIEGLMEYYQGSLKHVKLSGPTYFGPVIEFAKKIAEGNQGKDVYTILLILTDGEIHDMDKTADLISKCSTLPISIIIVGVGNERFDQMRKLDGDDGPLKKHAGIHRDLVQFVAFQDHKNDVSRLACDVLAELPLQLVRYKLLRGEFPKTHQSVHLSQMM